MGKELGMSAAQRQRKVERWLPLGYLLLALALVVAVLPTVLRVQPPQSNQAAELSPDAPPDKRPSIIAALNSAGSATAGGGFGAGASASAEGASPPTAP